MEAGSCKSGPCDATEEQQHQQTQQIGTVSFLLANGIAGAFSKTCTAPISRLTILFQVQGMQYPDAVVLRKPSIGREVFRIVNEEGYRAFWKGNLVTIAHRFPYTAVNFYSYERYKCFLKSFTAVEGQSSIGWEEKMAQLVGGGLAGTTASSAAYPLDLVRTRLATQRNTVYYRGIGHAFRTIRKDEGIFGLYKGLGATLLMVGPRMAINFCIYDSLKSHWHSQRPKDSVVMSSFVCGSLAGIVSSTATFPIDLVRRRMQIEGAGAGTDRVHRTYEKGGFLGTFGQVMRSDGFRGLYRGILLEYCRVVPGIGILFMTGEFLKKIVSDFKL